MNVVVVVGCPYVSEECFELDHGDLVIAVLIEQSEHVFVVGLVESHATQMIWVAEMVRPCIAGHDTKRCGEWR